jgi:hypothetical protein
MKIRPVGDELFHADGRTDMTTLIVAFSNFAKAPKKVAAISELAAFQLQIRQHKPQATEKCRI